MLPVLLPLQSTSVTLDLLTLNNVGSLIVALPVFVQPLLSVMVKLYVPAIKPLGLCLVDVYVPGEKAIYDLLNVTFIVDEELKGWLEIHDWIRAMTFPKEFTEYQNLGRLSRIASATKAASDKPKYSDASITILSSSNKPYFKFKYYDCFPTSLSTFIMGANDSPESTMSADATFRYSYFDVEKLI
jgi:hypothetical protein